MATPITPFLVAAKAAPGTTLSTYATCIAINLHLIAAQALPLPSSESSYAPAAYKHFIIPFFFLRGWNEGEGKKPTKIESTKGECNKRSALNRICNKCDTS